MQVRHQELLLKLLQQQAPPTPPTPGSPPPLWAGLTKQGLSMKALLEHKPPPTREPTRTQAPNHRVVSRRDPEIGGGLEGSPLGLAVPPWTSISTIASTLLYGGGPV